MKIIISKDFSETPGPRLRKDGKFSGEEFREEILFPKYQEAKKENLKLLIDFDGGYGYLISFLEEAFGGLARIENENDIFKILEFKSIEEPSLIDDVKSYIKNARNY